MINSVFGLGTMTDYEDGRQICLYVSSKKEWEKGYCSDYTEKEEANILEKLGFVSEMDAVFTLLPSMEQITREEAIEKLTKAGFEYDEKFEAFMKGALGDGEDDDEEEGWDD